MNCSTGWSNKNRSDAWICFFLMLMSRINRAGFPIEVEVRSHLIVWHHVISPLSPHSHTHTHTRSAYMMVTMTPYVRYTMLFHLFIIKVYVFLLYWKIHSGHLVVGVPYSRRYNCTCEQKQQIPKFDGCSEETAIHRLSLCAASPNLAHQLERLYCFIEL